MKLFSLTFSIILVFISQTVISQESLYIKLEKIKTGPLISSQYPQAGAIVLTSEVGELEFSAQPEPVDTRIRKEGKGKATKYNYTLFFESDVAIEMTIIPRSGVVEEYHFNFQVEKKIANYYKVSLSKEIQSGQAVYLEKKDDRATPADAQPLTQTEPFPNQQL